MDGMMGGGTLSPEQIRALLEYSATEGAFNEQDRAVQQQLAQANALRNRQQSQHTTGAGAMFGGIGDMLNAYTGKKEQEAAQARDLAQQQARIDALRRLAAAYGQQQQPQLQPGLAPISPNDPGI